MPPAVCIVEFTRSGRGTLSSTDPPRHLVVRGIGTYTDDLKLPGLLHATILRSPHAHARVLSIDTRSARRIPGVVAVLVGADINDKCGVVPCSASLPGLKAPRHTVLAGDRVYFVGHGVVVAVATDPYLARDAVEAIEVDYDPLPAVVNPEEALKAGALLTHPDLGTNVAYTHTMGGGDIDDAFRRADKIIGQRLIHQRLTPMPIEPRAGVASFHAGEGTLTIWTATQVPHLVRTLLPGMIAIAENKLRIIVPEVGGGFGAKLNVYAEEALCGHLAMRLGAAVKWVESRRGNAAATIHGRDQIGNYKMAVKSDGTIAIGAMATHYAIESSSVLWDRCPLLSETAAQIDDVQIRNRGTIGGNLAHADPAADWPATISRARCRARTRRAQGSANGSRGRLFSSTCSRPRSAPTRSCARSACRPRRGQSPTKRPSRRRAALRWPGWRWSFPAPETCGLG